MDKADKSLVVGLFLVAFCVVSILTFAVLMGEKEKSETPETYLEFSPKQGVTCIKTGYGIGCWKD